MTKKLHLTNRTGPETGNRSSPVKTSHSVALARAEVFERGDINDREDFFHRDGDSLEVPAAIARLDESLNLHLPVIASSENPTIARRAQVVDTPRSTQGGDHATGSSKCCWFTPRVFGAVARTVSANDSPRGSRSYTVCDGNRLPRFRSS